MTTQDFIKYYKNGHGKAVYALQSIADKEPTATIKLTIEVNVCLI